LGHAERAGIHSEKKDALRAVAVASQIHFVSKPRVTERIVNMRDRRSEGELVDGVAETARGGD
jgi:hypothetical protein